MEEEKQYSEYSVDSTPRAYMTMRDYKDLPYQWQQPVERNPSEYRSMRDYRDQWMRSPYGSTYNHSWGNHTNSSWEPRPPQYAHPEPPFYASTPQSPKSPQPPQSIPPFEQAILDLTWIVEENKEINAHSIVTVEDNLNKKIDGLKVDFEHKWDNLQDSIEDLIDQQQCPPEEECQSGTMVEEPCLQQPQEILVENFEPSVGAAICLWEDKEATFPLTERSSGHETVERTQKLIIQPNPIELNPSATAQPQNNPLPVAPSDNQVYILPSPAPKSTNAAPAPNHKSNPLSAMQKFKRLVASVHKFATTSKAQAAAYTAWHSGWFWCRFGFGASEPRHF